MADTTLPALFSTGDHASRPAASAIGSGGLYSCTDHALVYQTDGSSWTTWATIPASVLNKYDATVAPAVTDDTGDGYSVGSVWVDVTGDAAYICVDASSGAAVWLPFDSASGESWEGAWSAGTYTLGQIVEHNDVVYQVNAASTADEPPGTDWDVLYTAPSGTSLLPPYGYNWSRIRGGVNAVGGENSTMGRTTGATDGSSASSADSNSATVPHSHIFYMAQSARVSRVEIVYANSNNRAKAGTIDYSDDLSTWTTAASFDDASTSRTHTFTAATAKYWRVRTTETGQPGIAGCNITEVRFIYAGEAGTGIDFATGLTPTSNRTYSNIAYATSPYENLAATATAAGSDDYLRVDLGAAKSVDTFHVVFTDTSHVPYDAILEYSSDDSSWSTAARVLMGLGLDTYEQLLSPISARYWRLRENGNPMGNGIDYRLFQLWGEP